jgi:hypothetical protein
VHRNPVLLFPNRRGGLKAAVSARMPLDRGGVQTTLHKVVAACGIKKTSARTAFVSEAAGEGYMVKWAIERADWLAPRQRVTRPGN